LRLAKRPFPILKNAHFLLADSVPADNLQRAGYAGTVSPFRGMIKILLVEDSKFLRIATERALARAGYGMTSASDGVEALKLAREKSPDLILLDMLLPRMSGLEVLKALRKDPLTSAIPVIVMTGMSQKNALRLQQDGACGFLEKSTLELDKGADKLLAALDDIVKKLAKKPAQATTA
jgi:CheY-like chemotaxis protein